MIEVGQGFYLKSSSHTYAYAGYIISEDIGPDIRPVYKRFTARFYWCPKPHVIGTSGIRYIDYHTLCSDIDYIMTDEELIEFKLSHQI
jgi:hypothetical protein